MAENFLIISASMGAGHDGAARELARRLESKGHSAEIIDFLECTKGVGGLIKRIYQYQLEVAPWSYELLYKVFFKLPSLYGPLVWLATFLSSFRVRKAIERTGCSCVITTYPLASLVLGKERSRGRISVPTATFVTDFAVHPLWVHPGIDLTMCVHPQAALQAQRATGNTSFATGPMVPERFFKMFESRQTDDRYQTKTHQELLRRKFSIPKDAKAILVVAGSWGVGELHQTYNDLQDIGGYFPVFVCGSNEKLQQELQVVVGGNGLVLGWTNNIHQLMGACDILLQNAGGLTCMEAFAAGLPVVTYRPIPGHGVENAIEMLRAGVAKFARSKESLEKVLDEAFSTTSEQVSQIRKMFRQDPADIICEFTESDRVATQPKVESGERYDAKSSLSRALGAVGSKSMGALAAASALYMAFAFGGTVAVAHGLDAVHTNSVTPEVYLGVRVPNALIQNPQLGDVLERFNSSLIVDGYQSKHFQAQLRMFERQGVDIQNGGSPSGDDPLAVIIPHTTVASTASELRQILGHSAKYYVPLNHLSGLDLSEARLVHEKILLPTARIGSSVPALQLKPGSVVSVQLTSTNLAPAVDELQSINSSANQQSLNIRTLGQA